MAVEYPDTWVEMANQAIARIGKQPISSLTEGSTTSGYCNTYLGEVVDQVCSLHDWNGLKKRVQLARLSDVPAYGYGYYYQLPTGFVRPVEVLTEGDAEYSIEIDKVATDSESVYLTYIARPTDPALLPSYLFRLMTAGLALRITTPLVSSEAIVQRLASEYNDAVVTARRHDSARNMDSTMEQIRGYDWYEDER